MAISGAAERLGAGEGRARLFSLLALALVLPVGFAVSSWRDVKDVFWKEELRPVRVEPGEAADYAGATFRLKAFKVVTGERGDPKLKMPPDRALALVRIEATATRDVDPMAWIGCALAVTDAAGRRWKPLFLALTRDVEKLIAPDAEEAQGCSGASLAPKTAGTRLLIEEKFLIPRDAIATLSASFSVASERPAALRFAAAAERQ
jgi:hypothetical protein